MSVKILDNALLKALLDESIPFYDVMNSFNIRTTIAFNMPSSVYGFVYVSRRKNYHIVLNGNVNYKTQCKTFIHEIKHIVYDTPNNGYIIGIDMQHSKMEIKADNFKLDDSAKADF